MNCNKTGKPWAGDNCGSCGFNGDCEAQPPTPYAGFAGSIADSLSVEECREIISSAHDHLRHALMFEDYQPFRFDYYAQCITDLLAECRELRSAVMKRDKKLLKLSK